MKKTFIDSDKVLAVFTDRNGGVSQEPFDTLNFAFHVGDEASDVEKNHQILKKDLGIDSVAYMEQIHSNNIEIVDVGGKIKKTDGLITKKRNLALMAMVADCIPILFYDPENKVIAVAHSGRKGTFKNIAEKTVLKMRGSFGSSPQRILVSLGSSIEKCCYQVDDEIIKETKKIFGDKYITNNSLDLKEIVFDQLIDTGIEENNIEIINECTVCNKNYFSYRRDGKTGRCAGVIMLK